MRFCVRKTKKLQKEEKTVLDNIKYINSLNKNERLEVYKKMLGIKNSID